MLNRLSAPRPLSEPYATFISRGKKYFLLRTYKSPSAESKDPEARWLVAEKLGPGHRFILQERRKSSLPARFYLFRSAEFLRSYPNE